MAAVQTRKQKLIEERALKPLKISKDEALNITTEQFKKMQRDDPELKKYWRLAEKPDETGRSWYCVEQEILYRRYRNEKTGNDVKQLMLPEEPCLEEHGWIERSNTAYASPIVIV